MRGLTIVVLSGPMGSGKSTLAEALVHHHGARRVSTRTLLQTQLGGEGQGRLALQAAGEELDRRTQGGWLAQAVETFLRGQSERVELLVVDAVRVPSQVAALRRGSASRVVHVHLSAPEEVLSERYAARRAQSGGDAERASFEEARANATERGVEALAAQAELEINTQRTPPEAVLVRVASLLGLFGRGVERLVDVLVGGQYGSEGKGHIVAHLAPEYEVLVRVGGPNAGHKVYEEPEPYTFHMLPSGTRVARQAQVVLGPGTMLSLDYLREEITACGILPGRLFIDPQACVIETQDIEFEEAALKEIGSTAQGVGAATSRKVLRTAARPPVRLARDVEGLQPFLRPTTEVLDAAYTRGQKVLLEGTQGMGLSLHHGSYPYVTSRDTTASGCLAEAGIAPGRVRKVVMVCRTYPIRVQDPEGGTSGPMVGELTWEDIAQRSGLPQEELEDKERTSTTKRQRRVGEFDWVLLRKAALLNAPTDVALTFVDYLSARNFNARRFTQLTDDAQRHIEDIECVVGAPVSLVSKGFHYRSILDRRNW